MPNIRKLLHLFLVRDQESDDRQQEIADMINAELHDGTFPLIVCLCGSTRFFKEFQEENFKETMKGNIVLSVGFYPHAQKEAHHSEDVGITKEQKIELDELHKRKIDLADEIYVLNKGGYVGESTRSEIAYAMRFGKPVRYLEPYGA
jgi:hypothetical protein